MNGKGMHISSLLFMVKIKKEQTVVSTVMVAFIHLQSEGHCKCY